MVTRLQHWPGLLTAFLAEREPMPFAWHGNDCCTFAADAVLAITGHDFIAEERALYCDAASALRLLQERGGLEQLARAKLGEPMQYPLRAKRGDVGLVPAGPGGSLALAVCAGMTWRVPGPRGLQPLDFMLATAAWKVG